MVPPSPGRFLQPALRQFRAGGLAERLPPRRGHKRAGKEGCEQNERGELDTPRGLLPRPAQGLDVTKEAVVDAEEESHQRSRRIRDPCKQCPQPAAEEKRKARDQRRPRVHEEEHAHDMHAVEEVEVEPQMDRAGGQHESCCRPSKGALRRNRLCRLRRRIHRRGYGPTARADCEIRSGEHAVRGGMKRIRGLNARSLYSLAALAVLLAVVGAVVAGCGGGGSAKSPGNGSPTSGSTMTNSNTSGSTTGSTTTKPGWG